MITPTGIKLKTGTESIFSVFDVKTGKLLYEDQVFSNGASVFSLGVSPDGRYAFAGGSGVTSGVGGRPVMSDPNQLYVYRLPLPLSASDQAQGDHKEEGKTRGVSKP
jgi:hypothetical protein